MGEFIIALLAGLAVAAIVGLTTMSFNRPRGYRRVSMALTIALLATSIGNFFFTLGLQVAESYLPVSTDSKAVKNISDLAGQVTGWGLWVSVAMIVLLVVGFLPDWIGKD